MNHKSDIEKSSNQNNSGIIIDRSLFKPINSSIFQDSMLSKFQKILLTTDGTVTDLVSIYINEKIRVKKIYNKIVLSNDNETFLCDYNTPILKRIVMLCGKTNQYIYAESIFIFERLSRTTQYKLLETDIPIGLLWKEERTESFREILGYDIKPDERIAKLFNVTNDTPIVSRSYLIYQNHKITGIITEKFPISFYREDI